MLQPTLTRRIENALGALKQANVLTQVLDSLEQMHISIDQSLLSIAKGGGIHAFGQDAQAIHNLIGSLPKTTRNLNARTLFQEIDILKSRFSVALIQGVDKSECVSKFITQLEEFAETYNAYIGHQAGENGLPLLLVSRRFRQSIIDLQDMLEYLAANSSGSIGGRADEAEISLVLLTVSELGDFSARLAALDKLYRELCYVLGVSVASHPLRIGKIESGSLWTRLFGDTKVIGLMVSFIEESVRFLHRNYTTEGKLEAIPKKLESLNVILNFSNRLKDSGVDVVALQDSLAKSAVSIANNLNTLVSGQSAVEVNGQLLSVGAEVDRALLEHVGIPKLGFESTVALSQSLSPPTDGGSGVV